MIIQKYFFDPDRVFEYVSDSVLWERIFTNPAPTDFPSPGHGQIILSDYFTIEEITNNGILDGDLKLLSASDSFHSASEELQSIAFVTLCSFLQRFKRPYRYCYLDVPAHSSVEKIDDYNPLSISCKRRTYPELNEEKTMFRLTFDEDAFIALHRYHFGLGFEKKNSKHGYDVDFPFEFFRAFLFFNY